MNVPDGFAHVELSSNHARLCFRQGDARRTKSAPLGPTGNAIPTVSDVLNRTRVIVFDTHSRQHVRVAAAKGLFARPWI